MKKIILTLIALIGITASACAMSYEQARNEALFLTDKMAYELNLTDAQYEAAYEINLDYLMSVTNRDNVFGIYWEHRNHDINCILYAWQWEAFCAATYFYRPLFWEAGYWHFGIYARYPHRTHFYYGRPHFYISYRGGHSWYRNGGRSYYSHHHDHYRPHISHDSHFGMRDRWNRGDFNNHRSGNSSTRHHEDGNIRNRSIDTHNNNNSENARNRSTGSDHSIRHGATIDNRTSSPSRDFNTHKNNATNSIRQSSVMNNARQNETISNMRQSGATSNIRQSGAMSSMRQSGATSSMRQSGAMSSMRQSGATSSMRQSGAMSSMRQSGAMSGARQSSTRQSVSRQSSGRHR